MDIYIYFLMWLIFKVFTELVTMLLLFYVLFFWPGGMRDLRSLTSDRTYHPCIRRRSPNHWRGEFLGKSLEINFGITLPPLRTSFHLKSKNLKSEEETQHADSE